jgi:hypothetical protein
MEKQDMFRWRYGFFLMIFLIGTLLIIGSGGGGGGGDSSSESSDSGTETTGAGSEIIELSAVLGPIVGADVDVAPLDNLDNIITAGTTEDADDLNDAGRVSLEIPAGYTNTPLYVRVSGGVDIDVQDDGIRDGTPTDNDVDFYFAVPTQSDLEGMTVVANPLLWYASKYVISGVEGGSNLPAGYEPSTDPEAVRTVMHRVAAALIEEDVDGDGVISWEDIVTFHPLVNRDKSYIPWDYVLDDIERSRADYLVEFWLSYGYIYHLDPGTQAPYDYNGDGDWKNDRGEAIGAEADSYVIDFNTNLNGYTVQDLLDGQGARGGRVTFPGNTPITYTWTDIYGNSGSEENDTQPPLLIHEGFTIEDDLRGELGGTITDPPEAPVGEYVIDFTTGDGQQHQQTLYLHENSAESLIYPVAQIQVDDNNEFIEQIKLQFEDENGDILENPPVLWVAVLICTEDSVDTLNDLIREQGFYVPHPSDPVQSELTLYYTSISIVDPTASFFPTNNGHGIYYEDAFAIYLQILGGDGVNRSFCYMVNNALYPQLDRLEIDYPGAGQLYATYVPSSVTGREVVSIRYRFDNTDWSEVEGDTLTTDIPDGANTIYITAKDTSGFYFYAPGGIGTDL